jgi:hypothetical protein
MGSYSLEQDECIISQAALLPQPARGAGHVDLLAGSQNKAE